MSTDADETAQDVTGKIFPPLCWINNLSSSQRLQRSSVSRQNSVQSCWQMYDVKSVSDGLGTNIHQEATQPRKISGLLCGWSCW